MRALLVDDHEVVRRGVRELLSEAYPDTEFGEASTVLIRIQRQDPLLDQSQCPKRRDRFADGSRLKQSVRRDRLAAVFVCQAIALRFDKFAIMNDSQRQSRDIGLAHLRLHQTVQLVCLPKAGCGLQQQQHSPQHDKRDDRSTRIHDDFLSESSRNGKRAAFDLIGHEGYSARVLSSGKPALRRSRIM